ncbi:O-acyltransferase WSD1 [Zostera marina]|uniref:O-acyltransferase WSD1 n=1 Tax=Zostera marina TaxID=29655 RepID=A0A0K9PB27_ZOSMR|nr:O-acyltransferase WSD1 [Zostera marina]
MGDEELRPDDQPITPAGRFFLVPRTRQFVHAVLGFRNPIDVRAMKNAVRSTLMRHPRFTSILVEDGKGIEHWRKLVPDEIDLDRQFVLVPEDDEIAGGEDFVNEYIAGLAIDIRVDTTRPLWEMHLLRSNRCCVLRIHHALGDGVSFMALFLASCKRVDDPTLPPTIPEKETKSKTTVMKRMSFLQKTWRLIKVAGYTLLYLTDFILYSFWTKDEKTPISGGDGVELWPRMVRNVTFELADMKLVKDSINATINDVLLGIVSLGLERYLERRNPSISRKPIRITGCTMVNLRKTSGIQNLESLELSKAGWGNNFGFMLLPLCLWKSRDDEDTLESIRRVKKMTDKKKLSLEAYISLKGGTLIMSTFGKEVASKINYKISSNTTFTISNVMGPLDEMMFAENPITYIRSTSSGLPQAVLMHMVSYNGKADMMVQVAKDIIPDVEVLVKCFEDSLRDMKECVMRC